MPTSDQAPVILITGAARRIGAVIARTLHAAGCNLALHFHRSDADMRALCAELEAARADSTLSLQADLTDVAAAPVLVEAAVARFGRLDGLVNNAAAYSTTPFSEMTPEQWDHLLATNARAPFFLCQAAAFHLRQSHGAIVNMTDIYARHPTADRCVYAMSKAAVTAMTRALALELAPEVRVNAIAPGAIIWPQSPSGQDARQAILERTPLARCGTADEIADAVFWLLSAAGFMTGQVINIDGGRNIEG